MKTNYLLLLTLIMPWAVRANTPDPTSALAFQQTTNTRIVVEENHLRFFTGGSERMTIDESGNMGIGSTSPDFQIHLKDPNGGAAFGIERGGKLWRFDVTSSEANRLFIGHSDNPSVLSLTNYGSVGIGINDPQAELHVDGKMQSSFVDIGLARPTSSYSEGLFVKGADGNGYASIQLATRSWSGSHAILFNAYKSPTMVNGGLGSVGNTKFTHNVGNYGGGAASIFYTGNGGVMSFHVSQASTGAGTDVNWGTAKLMIQRNGTVGININDPNEIYMLHVNGKTYATSFHTAASNYADFVFEDDYRLAPLSEVEAYIEENNHLPDIPSETEAKKNGVDLQEMQAKLLQKIEELTLYVIEQNKRIEEQQQRIQQLEKYKK
ncbi:MAG: hypothetical protein ABJO02_06575 [Reichenbachiella sp.]|uniref:hypothetical protein n=1 Tax=Reichenbachiella sp. TaxID=2184521 RepID=UPI0032986593